MAIRTLFPNSRGNSMSHQISIRSVATGFILLSLQISCGGGSDAVAPSVVTSLSAVSAISTTATVGTVVAAAPSVVVKDQRGNPMAGVTVTFAVGTGSGTITGASQVTGASGVATVGSWTLGTVAGTNTLTATTGSLVPVTFSATGTAGPATVIVKTAGDGQQAATGFAVATAPSVAVKDAYGNPVSGAIVSFVVGAGAGVLTGAVSTSNGSGLAAVGSWTLGPFLGTNTVTAAGTGLSPVVFTATATAPVCVPQAMNIPATMNGALIASSCFFSDRKAQTYSTQVASTTAFRLTALSTQFSPFIAVTSDLADSWFYSTGVAGSPLARRWLVPAGSYRIALATENSQLGSFTLTSAAESQGATGCEGTNLMGLSITTSQTLSSTDCAGGGYYYDAFHLVSSRPCTITMSSSVFDAYLEIYDYDGALVYYDDDSGGGTSASISLTSCRVGYQSSEHRGLRITPTSYLSGSTGAYTLAITFPSSLSEKARHVPVSISESLLGGRPIVPAGVRTSKK